MKLNKNRAFIIFCLITTFVFSFALTGCGTGGSPSSTPPPQSAPALTVSAAASLTDALKEIKELYAKEKPNVTLTINFGGSGALQQQIEQGAPVDVFMSAAATQMDALQNKGLLLDGSRKDMLKNKVVLIVPSGSTAGIADFKDLADSKVKKIAIGEPKSVPAGQYADEIFTKQGLSDKVKDKLVYAKDVRAVLTYVESGEVDAGVVFLTDAKTSTKVKVAAPAPDASHAPVIYPAAVIKSSKSPDAAKDFITFLGGSQAKAVFEKYGFTVAQ
ncbi:MAG: molybdate ABC transporter substrate-binding protein [Firmicutes bacterium]|nr:molybdate ABC transporter substrate-binding protein [Bacillota bacterium]